MIDAPISTTGGFDPYHVGVATLGAQWRNVKIEGSVHWREPMRIVTIRPATVLIPTAAHFWNPCRPRAPSFARYSRARSAEPETKVHRTTARRFTIAARPIERSTHCWGQNDATDEGKRNRPVDELSARARHRLSAVGRVEKSGTSSFSIPWMIGIFPLSATDGYSAICRMAKASTSDSASNYDYDRRIVSTRYYETISVTLSVFCEPPSVHAHEAHTPLTMLWPMEK